MNAEPLLSLQQAKDIVSEKIHPRVSEESIKTKIKSVEYLLKDQLTICIIEMENGWLSTGVSAPASPKNYDVEVGKRYAYENAFKPLFQLEGYLLRQRLHDSTSGPLI